MHMITLVLGVAGPDPGSGAFFDDVTKPVLWSREPRPKLNCHLEPELRIAHLLLSIYHRLEIL
jgi:hypothetical protein